MPIITKKMDLYAIINISECGTAMSMSVLLFRKTDGQGVCCICVGVS